MGVREEGGEERWQMSRGAESEGREGARQHMRGMRRLTFVNFGRENLKTYVCYLNSN